MPLVRIGSYYWRCTLERAQEKETHRRREGEERRVKEDEGETDCGFGDENGARKSERRG